MLVLSRRDLGALVAPLDVIGAVEAAFVDFAAGRARASPRAGLPLGGGALDEIRRFGSAGSALEDAAVCLGYDRAVRAGPGTEVAP
jgi:ornithine cyclodeaminase/alanine dehydrogenase-like protein (mu-crystallin family)